MKKIISVIITVSVFAVAFVGCGGTQADGDTKDYTTNGKETKFVADETATGELTVSFIGFLLNDESDKMSKAKNLYKESFPNVDINLDFADFTQTTYEDYFMKLGAEIMAGNGPDVFGILNDSIDPYKMIKAGAYENLFPYFEEDVFFNPDDYYINIFKGGQDGQTQYFVPTEFYLPLYITTESLSKEVGLDIKECKDYLSTAEVMGEICEENKLNCDSKEIIYGLDFPYVFPARSGIDWIDIFNEKITLNSKDMAPIFEVFKTKLFPHIKINDGSWTSQKSRGAEAEMLLGKRSVIVEMSSDGTEQIIDTTRSLINNGEKPVLFSWKDVTGSYTAQLNDVWAVNSSSPNKENAYQFIKMMVSNEFLMPESKNYIGGISVNKNEVKKQLGMAINGESYYLSGNGNYENFPLPQKYADEFLEILASIDNAEIPQIGNNIIRKEMQQYFEGKKTYDECIKSAQSTLEIYVSE